MSKPSAAAIRRALPLCKDRLGADPILVCSICGKTVDQADLPSQVWRECDERDQPLAGSEHVLFLGTGKEHDACRRILDAHARLYVEETGKPGYFPRLCGGCVHRDGFTCEHRDLKVNGGPGLLVILHDPFKNAILCGRGGQIRIVPPAVECQGRRLPQDSAEASADEDEIAHQRESSEEGGPAIQARHTSGAPAPTHATTGALRRCGRADCGVSTAIDEVTLTFGSGELDDFGFWEKPCAACARAWEANHPGERCWPPELG